MTAGRRTRIVSHDRYAEHGELHDLFMDEPWERLRPRIREVFGSLPASAVVCDVGAGTGMGTRVLAAESAARIVAVEPSLTMRAVLTGRVADSAELSRRVTVVAGGLPDSLPELTRVDGLLAAHLLGGVSPAERAALWTWLDRRLSEHGRALLTVHEPTSPSDAGALGTDETADIAQSRRIGEQEYRVTYRHDADDTFSVRYRVFHDDQVVRDLTFAGSWQPVTLTDIASELAATGLAAHRIAPAVAVVSRRSDVEEPPLGR